MKTETHPLKSNPNVTLTTYMLDPSQEMANAKVRPAILIFPGGGYRICSDREAEPIAMAFLAQGYHAFVLRYSLNENAAFPRPIQDAEEALELIRSNAGKWGVIPDRVAVCGFSAGGHLAAALGTMGRIRPNALILGYPVILDTISGILPFPIPSVEQKVDPQTPPAFIFATANDELVPVKHSLQFAAAMDQAKVPFELHIFQDGSHGLSLAKTFTSGGFKNLVNPDVAKWMELCTSWLEKLFCGFGVEREALVESEPESDKTYNVDLPLEICWKNPECQRLILTYFPGIDQSPNLKAAMSMSLRVMNGYGRKLDDDGLNDLDQKLRAIPFKNH